ncbi:MAG: hypothetical protein U0X39_04845 [Bacteroidales bacterium]
MVESPAKAATIEKFLGKDFGCFPVSAIYAIFQEKL